MKKHITIKVFDSYNNFQKVWKSFEFDGFSKEINGGLGACVIILGEKFDYAGSDLQINNEVQIFVTDKETIGSDNNEILIYSGYISQINREVINERIKVTLLGYYTKLSQGIHEGGGGVTTIPQTGDIGALFRNLMTRYMARVSNPKLNYTAASIQRTYAGSATYTFEMMTYRESIDKMLGMSPNNWYWYVNAFNLVSFSYKATSAFTDKYHSFIFGRHFRNIKATTSIEKIKNSLLFWNGIVGVGEIYKLYSDAESIIKHDRRTEKMTDRRVGDEATADMIGAAFVDKHKIPAVSVQVEIVDSNLADDNKLRGYDIESIEPGDICNFYGFDETLSDIFQEDMMINKVEYRLDKAIITVEPMGAGVVIRQENIATNVDQLATNGAPTTYTT